MHDRFRRGTSSRWTAGAVVACIVPLAVYCSLGGAAFRGRTFPGFFVTENRQLPSAGAFDWTGLRAGVPFHGRVVAVDGVPVARAGDV